MKQLRSIFFQFLFWMLLFAIERILFLSYYSSNLVNENIAFSEILKVFSSAIKLDMSTTAYLLIVPYMLAVSSFFTLGKLPDRINKTYTGLVLLIYLLITSGELGLYDEWKTKLSYKALLYLRHPGEVFHSIPTASFLLLTGFVLVQFFLFYFVYNKLFYKSLSAGRKVKPLSRFLFILLLPGLILLGARGGFSEIPITVSDSYFSKHNLLNKAAVNNGYNLAFSTIDYYQLEQNNLFRFMPSAEARSIVNELHKVEKDTTVSILNTGRPNIVLIFLESWAGDVIQTLGGDSIFTPSFHKMESEGLMFTNFYASGNRSQQALASVFGGLPALPVTTLADNPQKYKSVPSLVSILNDAGYSTSFYFGGDLNYGNIKSYLMYNQFDTLVDENGFVEGQPRGKLGFHDEVLFAKMLADLNKLTEPFFLSTLTLSSHSPYDFPGPRPIKGYDLHRDYLNSVRYTDEQLGRFFSLASQTDWFERTVFIILADHSHSSYKNYYPESFNYRHIPLLITGGALKNELKGRQSVLLCGNTDLPSTILNQLGLPDTAFYWSKNIFNPYSPRFAFFELNYGFGWMRPEGRLETDIRGPVDYFTNIPKPDLPRIRKEGEAYVQVLLEDFLAY